MGLDDFKADTDDSSSSSSSSDSDSSSTSTTTTKTTTSSTNGTKTSAGVSGYYSHEDADLGTRPMEREGAMSDVSMAELAETAEGQILMGRDHMKLHLPMFPIFTSHSAYEQGKRYQLVYSAEDFQPAWDGRVVVCTGSVKTTLGQVNKEFAMLETGHHNRADVMDNLDSRLGKDLDGRSEIHIAYFIDAMHSRDLAQAGNQFKEGGRINLDDVAQKMYRPYVLEVALDHRDGAESNK